MRARTTQFIYLSVTVTASISMVGYFAGDTWIRALAAWLCGPAVPLFFAFAYPRFLFATENRPKHPNLVAVLHAMAAVTAVVLFSALSQFGKNPVGDIDTAAIILLPLSAFVILLTAAVSVLLGKRSSVAALASIVFWPYWFGLAVVFAGSWFRDNPLYYILWFLSPIPFAFAAGALAYRPKLAHALALLGVLAAPWLCGNVIRDNGLGNFWLAFNIPVDKYRMYPTILIGSSILAVGVLVVALTTAVTRLLPSRWTIRGIPLCARTWPSFVVSLVVMAVWFSQSVMPYRIPGAVDYSDYPGFQILHIEKRGLRFHEACVSVGQVELRYRLSNAKFSVTTDDRSLFQYRFKKAGVFGALTNPLFDRIRAMIPARGSPQGQSDIIKPVRDWNADNWYFNVNGTVKIYGTFNGSRPPQEIVDLFNDLQKLPQSSPTTSELRDVCLGFCYDPLSAMGYLYANHRCFNAGHGTVCR